MNLEILTPERKFFTGQVYGVQLPGLLGSFEVLENHAAFVSALKKGTVKILKDKSGANPTLIEIESGFVEVLNNNMTVLVEGANPVEK